MRSRREFRADADFQGLLRIYRRRRFILPLYTSAGAPMS